MTNHRVDNVIRGASIGIGGLDDTDLHVFHEIRFVQLRRNEIREENRKSITIQHVKTMLFIDVEVEKAIGIPVNRAIFWIFGQR